MKKREFQKKATTELLRRLADVCMELKENPNITITSRYHSAYFKLRKNGNLIQISVKETGEFSYQLYDMLGSTDEKKIYYKYQPTDDHAKIAEKFAEDFGKLYKYLLLSGTLHEGFYCIELGYNVDADEALKELADYIGLINLSD